MHHRALQWYFQADVIVFNSCLYSTLSVCHNLTPSVLGDVCFSFFTIANNLRWKSSYTFHFLVCLEVWFAGSNRMMCFFFFIFIFFYFWLCWVFVSVRGLSLVVASGGHSSSRCAGLSLSRPLLLQSAGSRRAGSVIVAHGPSCCMACGIFPDQGSNLCALHWQADSQPLRHQGSPTLSYF